MKETISMIDTVDEIISYGAKKEVLQLNTSNFKMNGSKIFLNGEINKEVINFGSCSYLGLEFDNRLKQAAKDAIDCYGTQFSSSRTYISNRYYQELEGLLGKLFDAHVVVTPTTTLGHIGAIPLFIGSNDAVILDHQVHHSVQTAVNLIKSKGVHTELVRHNRMDLLEERIKVLRQTYKKVWYLADGIYSMFGDATPVDQVYQLLEKYPEFHFYVDDAHGMSCYGKNGRGYVLGKKPIHERMIVATSFAKAFATGGGALIFPTEEMARRFRTCGGPMIFSGPMQPSQLGAAIASAKIHLSEEINLFQQQLQSSIKYANTLIKKYELPLISETDSPVFFIGVSLPKIGYKMITRMINDGFYLNLGIFSAVPMKNTGVRFTITRNQSFKEIEKMVQALDKNLKEVLAEENFTIEQIYKAFKITPAKTEKTQQLAPAEITETNFEVIHCKSISQIDKDIWNQLLGERGSYNWEGMKFLENSFTGNEKEEDNWVFDYIIIKDALKTPVLATFLTTSMWKDDMLAPETVSSQIEAQRATGDPYYLVSKVLATGSNITGGNHLYIDRSSALWKDALDILLKKIAALQEEYHTSSTMLRDLPQGDSDVDGFMMENGYFKVNMPKSHNAEISTWNTRQEFMATLSKRMQKHIRQDVLHHEDKYELAVCKNPAPEEIKHWYQLYLNVKNKSLELNTFTLPYKMFENMAQNPSWEILTLTLKPEFDTRTERKPVAVMLSFLTEKAYNYMMVGIDYDYQEAYKPYRQAMFQALMRAKELGKEIVYLGYSASFEKRKVGALLVDSVGYMQAKDNYSLEVIESMSALQERR
ncbi:MAG TPA: aminotransferase class I/II-fold pyridoxal phosphate-dependent enzyme [Bacteroidia bacterium]|jgi:7-keto-8-aminopelargonate synthetase-like enzyme|nr:aminotransferase class I/II-fold pyridoxal phosphate-dependent enzyme [Bacteroidia bacterium]